MCIRDSIQLVVPVAHIWYFRSLPNKIGYLLGLPKMCIRDRPNRKKVAEITWEQVRTIAQDKMVDLNCFTVEAAKIGRAHV